MSSMAEMLDDLTSEGALYEKLPDNAVRCFACGHRCLIREGRRGICQVRFNRGGKLRVPWGYVAALQSDPIEKKPFFHVLPGANALTFGMLGCDYHCGYCFTGETEVITDQGPLSLQEVFDRGESVRKEKDVEISFPSGLKAVTSAGAYRDIRGVFRHAYRGSILAIKPWNLPAIRCTPDHRVYATTDLNTRPQLVCAADLTTEHYLVVPKKVYFSTPESIALECWSGSRPVPFWNPWELSDRELPQITDSTVVGQSARRMPGTGSTDPWRVKFRAGKVTTPEPYVTAAFWRCPNERQPGVPVRLELEAEAAELLGYYCARGSIAVDEDRPQSSGLNFDFPAADAALAKRLVYLLKKCLGVDANWTQRQTTLTVASAQTPLALLLVSFAGESPTKRQVPQMLFDASREVVKAFLNACIRSSGARSTGGKVSFTTTSIKLAHGIAWLAFKLGRLVSVSDAETPGPGVLRDQDLPLVPSQYTVAWNDDSAARQHDEPEDYHLLPIRDIHSELFTGDVFNMEVEAEHNYLAGFLLVSNCQNWLTSQAMRDPDSDVAANLVRRITPEQMVALAKRTRASVVVSSYNEPLITSEWAVEIFKKARGAGLMCAYVSNGNNTPEVMEYLRPYISAYKVDLKCMNDRNYRKLGGTLEHTLDGIRRARELGLWVEVVTLVIPGFNDSNEELWEAARFLAGQSIDIPWHVTAFHKDYKMTDPENTDTRTLLRAAEIGREAGLRFVYAGNLPGRVEEYEDTFCPQCNHRVVRRSGYVIREYKLTGEGRCLNCQARVPGLWPKDPSAVALNGLGMPLPVS